MSRVVPDDVEWGCRDLAGALAARAVAGLVVLSAAAVFIVRKGTK